MMSLEFSDKTHPQSIRLRGCLTATALLTLWIGGCFVARLIIPPDEQSTIAGARTALERRQPASARASLQRLLSFEPKHPEALFLLGACWNEEGRWGNAISAWSSIPQESSWSLEAQARLGFALLNDARLEEAERTLIAYLQRVPEADQARDELRWLLFNQFRTRELDQFLESQLKQFPDHPAVLRHLLYSEMRPPQPREGIVFFERTDKRRPGQTAVLTRLGYCYWQTGRIDEAQRRLQEALATDPTNRECLLTAAGFCIDQRAFDEAHKLLSPLIKENSQDDRAFFLESQIHEAAGRFEEALQDVDRTLQQRPYEVAYLQRSGSLQQRLGHADEAREKFREANRLEAIQAKLVEFVFRGVLEHPTPEICHAVAELCDGRGRQLQARGWRMLAAKMSADPEGTLKP